MSDAARPSDDKFSQILEKSLDTWSSYVNAQSDDHLLPRHAIDLGPLVSQTPPFLGGGLACLDKTASFACEEKLSTQSQGSLVINGRSTWRTSYEGCDSEPMVIPKQLLLAVGGRLDGLPSYDQGNYLSVLYFAWAYILSARWVELLGCSADHKCSMIPPMLEAENSSPTSDKQPVFEIDIGNNACEEEIFWWRTILCSDNGWEATTTYKGHIYMSPWSVSAKNVGFTLATNSCGSESKLPESGTALKYLSRFCVHHRLYAQCSIALAGNLASDSLPSIPDLLKSHSEIIPKYMTLSLNTWGLRSLLYSTFFNPDIECNLVSAWLNPAFAVISSIIQNQGSIATFMANRHPRLGILWLGAILTDLANSILRDVRAGMTALDLPASAWAGIAQTFLTSKMDSTYEEWIRRDDECRLLFITACEGHERPPIWPWKPFGSTQLGDTELPVRQHARCGCHCLEYEYWEWVLTDNSSIQCSEAAKSRPSVHGSSPSSANKTLARLDDNKYDFYSQTLSEGATRGVFEWLRSTGYPCSERPIYQHSWFDLEGTDEEEEPDDIESDLEIQRDPKEMHVERWLEDIE
ncbi:uncharacterized protein N7483_010151 [Penicillium malachiteum]|uniref:uncharacterized protein n=1 Tax=Penicillium malachiteum TaxID=1324776 RepID=UPI00254958A9|nr:uncharacterized protein N7483_010151 [Penicillium malachiteum]KAJ5712970.1 hypothetical protein N7483_010151 [Penicillium malachiteum]